MLSNLKKLALDVENITTDIEQFASQCTEDSGFQRMLGEYMESDNKREKSVIRSSITIFLTQKKITNPHIQSIYVIIEDSPVVITIDAGHKEEPVKSGGAKLIVDTYNQNEEHKPWVPFYDVFSDEHTRSLSYIETLKINDKKCNVIFITKKETFSGLISSDDGSDASMMISGFSGNTLLSSGIFRSIEDAGSSSLLEQTFHESKLADTYVVKTDEGEQCVVYYRSNTTFWRYYQVVPVNSLVGSNAESINMTIILLIAAVMAVIAGAAVLSRFVLQPLRGLAGGMKDVENGKFSQVIEKKTKDEIWVLQEGFNHMSGKLNSLINEVYLHKILRQQAQLKAIQSQIDEHFLYNTLNSIIYEAEEEGAAKTGKMLDIMSKYFRLNLSEGKSFVKVEEAVLLLKCYLALQKVRFGKRLNATISVDESLKDKYVLKYLFQPIVENAIIHGVEGLSESVAINTVFENRQGKLFFSVRNNGTPIDKDKLEILMHKIEETSSVEGENFALKNLNAQIALTYGKEHKISIESDEVAGTVVSFTIPLKGEEDVDDEKIFDDRGGR